MASKSKQLPLSGIRVLVGRARRQAGALSSALRKLGAGVVEIPFIEFRKPKSFAPLDSALKRLHEYDWLILTSVNGVEAMWQRMAELNLDFGALREGRRFSRAKIGSKTVTALSPGACLRIAAIGPATKKALEQRSAKVDVVPKEYVAESVVRSLRRRVKGKKVLLVRAKVARDVIPRELRKAGAHVDVVEAYETVVPKASRARLCSSLKNPRRRPRVITFTSSSTVRNFVALLGPPSAAGLNQPSRPPAAHAHTILASILTASIGPVTSSTLREMGLRVNIEAKEFTIPGLVKAIVRALA
ncbi:MAG: uroporphyrinogen-III synthase [Candidatus Sulfotelmatobacter sp.]